MKKLFFVLAMTVGVLCIGLMGNPILSHADRKAEVIDLNLNSGKIRFQVCTEDIIRVRYSPDEIFDEKDVNTFTINKDWEPVDYTITEDDSRLLLKTQKLQVQFDKLTEMVTFMDAEQNVILTESGRDYQTALQEKNTYYSISQKFNSPETEYLYGFGNVNDGVGLRNTNITVEQNNTRKRTPMFFSNQGYGILFDVTSNGSLTWPSTTQYQYTGNCTDSMDYYFFYGPDADHVISGYRTVTGQATMLPKNAFGYVQSRNRYSSQEELLSVVNTFRTKGIPLDTIVIDYYWWNGDFNNILEWSSNWPDPAKMMKTLHDNNVTAAISVWPSFRAGTKTYEEISQAGFLFDTTSNFGFNYDPSTPAGRNFYWNMINNSIWSKGLDSIWLDACEPETSNWVSNGDGEATAWGNSKIIGTLYPLLTNQGVYEGQRAIEGNEKRVNTLSRSAVAGIQRYGIQSWSGDIAANWNQFRQEIAGVINYSAAGLPYFSTDTGGYFGIDVNDPDNREMFMRWLEFSTFNSIMRVHGTDCAKEPWQFGSQYEAYITDYINLRERLLPYIYALAGQVTQNDYTMVRAMAFDFMDDPKASTISDQFMFGPAYMICPVYTPGATEREVYFPSGTWYNFWTGLEFESKGETLTVAAPIKQIPVFVRAGSIVPMGPFNQYASQSCDPIEVRVYRGEDGAFELYEDEGTNYNYEQGAFSTISFEWKESEGKLTLGEREGSFDGMLQSRTFHIVFVRKNYGFGIDTSEEYQVTVNYDGKEQSVTYDPNWEAPLPKLDPDSLPHPLAVPSALHSERAMVGEWSFDEGEGAKVGDISGNYNNGSLNTTNSNIWSKDGKVNSAIRFGNNTYVEVSNNDSLGMTEEISFSAWVNFAGGGHANILNKGGNGTNNPGFSFILLNGSLLQLEIQSAKNDNGTTLKTTAVSTKSFQAQAWHQVGFTWKCEDKGGDGIVRIFVDGIQVSDDSYAGNYFKGPIGLNGSGLRFGCSDVNEPNFPNYFNGLIDEAKLFNYELLKEEMVTLSKGETVTLPNVSELVLQPENAQIKITWKNPFQGGLSGTKIVCTGITSEETIEYITAPDVQNFTIENLENGQYYYISVISILEDGKESQGVNVVGIANDFPVTLDCLYTHDNMAYGYGINHTEIDITGDVIVKVYEIKDGKAVLVNTYSQESFIIPAQDNKQFGLEIGEFAENQFIEFEFVKEAIPYAKEKFINRDMLFVPFNSAAEIMSAIKIDMESSIQKELYSTDSVAKYDAVAEEAAVLINHADATQEQCLAMLNKLRTALVLNTSAEDTDSEFDLKVSETSAKAESKTKGTMLPVIIGIVLLAVITLIAGLFYFLKWKKRR